MPELEFDHNVFSRGRGNVDDQNLLVRFYTDAIQDDIASKKEERPIYNDMQMIEIRVKGDRNNTVIRPIREEDKRRFRNAWLDYSEKNGAPKTGTPLSQWPALGRSMVEELKFFGYYTVEDVAAASENAFAKMNGLRSFAEKAKAYLEYAKGLAPMAQMSDENQTLKAQLEDRERVIAEQAGIIKQLKSELEPRPLATAPAAKPR